jgi:hypothetical protein
MQQRCAVAIGLVDLRARYALMLRIGVSSGGGRAVEQKATILAKATVGRDGLVVAPFDLEAAAELRERLDNTHSGEFAGASAALAKNVAVVTRIATSPRRVSMATLA